MGTQTTEQMPRKKNVYNKERYEPNKEEILKYRLLCYLLLLLLFIIKVEKVKKIK
jgi:hypothetical protein